MNLRPILLFHLLPPPLFFLHMHNYTRVYCMQYACYRNSSGFHGYQISQVYVEKAGNTQKSIINGLLTHLHTVLSQYAYTRLHRSVITGSTRAYDVPNVLLRLKIPVKVHVHVPTCMTSLTTLLHHTCT